MCTYVIYIYILCNPLILMPRKTNHGLYFNINNNEAMPFVFQAVFIYFCFVFICGCECVVFIW